MRVGMLWCALLLLPVAARAQDLLADLHAEAQAEMAAAAKAEVRTETVTGDGFLRGRMVPRTTVTLGTGVADYALEYSCFRDEQGRRVPAGQPMAEVGMPRPVAANWYQGGFFDVLLDGTGLAAVPAEVETLKLPAGRAGVRFSWAHAAGGVSARFVTCSFDPFLYVVVDLPASAARQVKLLCYPNSFQFPRDRWLTTPRRDLQHRDRLREELGPEERGWVLYSDRSADPLRPPATGPCGLVLLPDRVGGVLLEMGVPERPDWPPHQNYGVLTTLTVRSDQQRLALALIDFAPTTWRQARDQMAADSGHVQARLREMLAGD